MKPYARRGMERESLKLQAQPGKKGRRERLRDPNVSLPDLSEADAAGAIDGGPGGHGLSSTAQPAKDEIPHRSTG